MVFLGDVDKLAQNGDNKLISAEWRKQQQRIYLTFQCEEFRLFDSDL